ncbi:MAG: bifunctional YncE family protein/alkaline phosphatase family protein [Isosphaeraceae bacterium]
MSALSLVLACLTSLVAANAQEAPRYAGATKTGFLLPNGWVVSPAGQHVIIPDLPLNVLALPDNHHALVATSGFNAHELLLIDLPKQEIKERRTVRESWFGLAATPDRHRIWWSGGGSNVTHRFQLDGQALSFLGTEPKAEAKTAAPRTKAHFRSGLAFDSRRNILYSLDIDYGTLTAYDPQTEKELKSAAVGNRPYDVALDRQGNLLYVSDWAGRAVHVVDPADLRTIAWIAVGEHPNQLAVHPKDDRIFVACASTDSVTAIDTRRGIVVETIHTALFPQAPEGSTPDALCIAPDGKTLFVACADNNCVAVLDISTPTRTQVKGFIPTGWYPSAMAITPDGENLLVGVGKGNQTKPNPINVDMTKFKTDYDPITRRRVLPFPYIGTTLSGSLSIVPVPDPGALAAFTETVYKNCPYSDKLLTDAPGPENSPIPTKVGGPSPIKHILYIIKENRTYDQVLGDLTRGNGDPSLVMFGRDATPNHHRLAEEFVLLDNLYCNGHVSADGHPWSTMAYNTDYIARNWALTYSTRTGIEDDEQGELSNAPSGYLWDACARAGLSYRSYGEYGRRVSQPDGSFHMDAAVPGLAGHICSGYGVSRKTGGHRRDTENAETFITEFQEFERNGTLAHFMVMSLGEDHTAGTRPGMPTPQACVASNDLALGRIVEAVTHSKSWPQTAIFVIEDDAQNGPDHVDAHRTVGLVISPYTKRKHLDSTQYSTVSMLRTIELLLGLGPLSQYDAAARPMFASFTDRPDFTPYVHEPARIDLNAVNTPTAYGAERSLKMDFSEYDRIDDFELNEILWRAIKGKDAPVPPAVRRAIAMRPVSEAKRP